MPYMDAATETRVVSNTVPAFRGSPHAEVLAERIVRVAGMIREAFEKEEIQCSFSTRRLLEWSEMITRYWDPMRAAENTIFSKVGKDDADVIRGIIQRVMLDDGGVK